MILTRRPKRQWSMQELSSVGAGLCCAPLCATYPAWQSGCVILHKSLGHRINSASPLWLRRLQAASTWCSCLLHMHGLAFTYNCSKTFSCEYSFCLTVEMMELLAFFFFSSFILPVQRSCKSLNDHLLWRASPWCVVHWWDDATSLRVLSIKRDKDVILLQC